MGKCLLLNAGKGTRMGKKSLFLPKGLWPLYDLKILEWQVLYLKYLGIQDIWVNLFYLKELFLEFQQRSPILQGVKFLVEPELLDVGGSVHFFAQNHPEGYTGSLFVCAGDQFLDLSFDLLQSLEQLSEVTQQHIITSVFVHPQWGHNQILVNAEGVLEGITLHRDIIKKNSTLKKDGEEYETFSAFSLIRLDKLSPQKGVSKFFESVCDYKKDKILVKRVQNAFYWDLGTIERYESTRKILEANYFCGKKLLLAPFDSILMQSAGQTSTQR